MRAVSIRLHCFYILRNRIILHVKTANTNFNNIYHAVSFLSIRGLWIREIFACSIARMVLVETYENTAHFDITYLMFVWMAFLPTVINPFVYASWILSR